MKIKTFLILILFILIITICCDRLSIDDWGNENTTSLPKSWQFIDGGGEYGINKNKYKSANYPSIVKNNNDIFVAWHESNAQVRVAKYNNENWTFIDGNDPDLGLNKNPDDEAWYPKLIIYNEKLYLTWYEHYNSNDNCQIRVAVWNGTDYWNFIDGNGIYGLNKNVNCIAIFPNFTVYQSNLYLTWVERNESNIYQVRVVKYNGNDQSPEWIFIDGDTDDGLNKDPGKNAGYPHIVSDSNNVYLIWTEGISSKEQVRIAKYNGKAWSFIDGDGKYGINKRNTQGAYMFPKIAVADSKLYASWLEYNDIAFQLIIAEWDGNNSWTYIDNEGLDGINYNNTKNIYEFDLTGDNKYLYSVWVEGYFLKIKKYNGTEWQYADGYNYKTGLNWDIEQDSFAPAIYVKNNIIYTSWGETSESNYYRQLRVIEYK